MAKGARDPHHTFPNIHSYTQKSTCLIRAQTHTNSCGLKMNLISVAATRGGKGSSRTSAKSSQYGKGDGHGRGNGWNGHHSNADANDSYDRGGHHSHYSSGHRTSSGFHSHRSGYYTGFNTPRSRSPPPTPPSIPGNGGKRKLIPPRMPQSPSLDTTKSSTSPPILPQPPHHDRLKPSRGTSQLRTPPKLPGQWGVDGGAYNTTGAWQNRNSTPNQAAESHLGGTGVGRQGHQVCMP